MWRASKNEIAHNKFDWCVRGYSHGVYDRGQDSAGILVFEQCSDNVFAYNSATHGGDGFFLYAGNETLESTGKGGCNRNLLYRNDFSHAVANGIEATFSDANIFAENILDDCSQHGVWGLQLQHHDRDEPHREGHGGGISIEHGHDNWIEGNTIEECTAGVGLWENERSDFAAKPYGKHQETRSLRNPILRNIFRKNRLAIDLRRTADTTIRWNVFDANETALRLVGRRLGSSSPTTSCGCPRAIAGRSSATRPRKRRSSGGTPGARPTSPRSSARASSRARPPRPPRSIPKNRGGRPRRRRSGARWTRCSQGCAPRARVHPRG